MKKIISTISIITLVLSFLTSCSSNKVKSVKVDEYTYYTFYLYSFKDAQIDNVNISDSHDYVPTSTGYIYSMEQLSSGDTIKVWHDFTFGEQDHPWTNGGTNATVDRLIDTYRIDVKKNDSTYEITYYTLVSSYYQLSLSTVTNKSDLEKTQKHKIEVFIERAIIEYDVK